jgi:hypothetical protein
MRRVFKDDALEQQFHKDGYVIIDFIDQKEVEFLKKGFFDLLPQSGGNILADETGIEGMEEITYDFTFIDKNIEYKQKVFDVISERFQSNADKFLDDYKPIIANYIRKKTDGGEVPLHQNWAFADEEKCSTVSIWCPLVDSNEENGTLQLAPGTHKRFGKYRGPMVPWELDKIQKEIIATQLVPANIKAGQAVILDDSIIHYSNVNHTNGLRLAIQLIMIPNDFPSIHYHRNIAKSQTTIEVLEVDKDFYMEFNPWKQPEKGKRIHAFEYEVKSLSNMEEYAERLKQPKFDDPKPKAGFFAKLKEMFN